MSESVDRSGQAPAVTVARRSDDQRVQPERNRGAELVALMAVRRRAGGDKKVRLWRAIDRNEPNMPVTLNGPVGRPLQSLAIAVDESRLAAGDDRGNVYLWDSKRYPDNPVALHIHRSPVAFIVFRSDGRSLDTTDTAGVGFRWSLREEDLKKAACQTVGRNLTKQEWTEYFPDEVYRKTCPDLPDGD